MTPDATPIAKSYGLYREPLPLPRWSAVSEQPSKRRTGAVTSLEDPAGVSCPARSASRTAATPDGGWPHCWSPFARSSPSCVGIAARRCAGRRRGGARARRAARRRGRAQDRRPAEPRVRDRRARRGRRARAQRAGRCARSVSPTRSCWRSSPGSSSELAERLAPLPRHARAAPAHGAHRDPRRRRPRNRSLRAGRRALAAQARRRPRGARRAGRGAVRGGGARRDEADEVVCVEMPDDLWAVGYWYEDFRPTSDEEVAELLAVRALTHTPRRRARARAVPAAAVEQVSDPDRGCRLALAERDLAVPPQPRGIVAFAHGSGSGRLSPRNRQVARRARRGRFRDAAVRPAHPGEEVDRGNVFDIPLLAARLARGERLAGRARRCRGACRSATSARAPARPPP